MFDGQQPRVPLGELTSIAAGIDHAEGICVTPDGTLYVSGEKGQVYRIDGAGQAVEVATTGGWTLGLAADGAGRIVACDPARHEVLRLDPADGSWTVLSHGTADAPFVTPNWGAYGPDGSFYVSDSGTWKGRDGRIVVIRPDGRTASFSTDTVDFPNGLAVSPDGTELWVLESTPGRLVRLAIRADGTAGARRVVAELPGTVPDGIAFATDGSAVIACYRPDIVFRWRPDGPPELLASDPEGTLLAAPTNAAFVGPDLGTIAVPNIGRWHVTTFRVDGLRGVPLHYPAAADLGY
ncbi:MAG: SMP-30/gluconolactonase/LRE family protein [Candidatus Limnocylindria bacterium]